MIELYRAMIPESKIINDNHGQHYRIHQGKLQWLTNQFNAIWNNELETPGDFKIPNLEFVKSQLGEMISIRCEVWRCTNRAFDSQNYAKMFKAPIDLLVKHEFIVDDNWKCVDGVTYTGGGSTVWKLKAKRFENDGLPEEMTPDWWNKYSDSYNDIFIRILVE